MAPLALIGLTAVKEKKVRRVSIPENGSRSTGMKVNLIPISFKALNIKTSILTTDTLEMSAVLTALLPPKLCSTLAGVSGPSSEAIL